MPLDPSALQSGLERMARNPPPSVAECARGWADAMRAYVAGITPPSSTVAAASSALTSALQGAFSSPAAAPLMEAAFASFAVTLGGGMVGFAPVPPAGPVGFAALFASPPPPSHALAAAKLTTLIDAWARRGLATMIAPPNTALPWS